MFTSVIESLKCSVPQELQAGVLETCRSFEERERARQKRGRNPKTSSNEFQDSASGAEGKDAMVEESFNVPVAIAEVMMQLWSGKMYRYVENLILTKAIREGYFESGQRAFVHALDGDLEEQEEEKGRHPDWVIRNQDETIIRLVWEMFNMKQHFDEVRNHRHWIKKTYSRLKGFLPELSPETIDRHDLTKYAFSQAIGYTLKWVHGISHPIWHAACTLHIYNEPHHKEMWSERDTTKQKRNKLETWLWAGSPLSQDCCHDGEGVLPVDCQGQQQQQKQQFPVSFLLESVVDMAAVEWERKKGCREDITEAELVTLEEKYLKSYDKDQYDIITNTIHSIKTSSGS
ncbi:uncharacterized protein LOC135223208 [Macrobrachium nipponense]|uniref:uncharacterized protein LOC135223208 n=1 Tax=Macrobrachium nipponense TaxID=159736 RepID=UPI0030C8AFCD